MLKFNDKQSLFPFLQKGSEFYAENESDLEIDDFTPYGTPFSTPMKPQGSGGSHHSVTRTPPTSEDVVKKLQFVIQSMDET